MSFDDLPLQSFNNAFFGGNVIPSVALAAALMLVNGSALAWDGALGLGNGLSHLQVRAMIDLEHDPALDEQDQPEIKRYHAIKAPKETYPATYLYTFQDDRLIQLEASYEDENARAEAERIKDLYGPPNTHEIVTLESGLEADHYVYLPHNFNLIRMAYQIELTEADESGDGDIDSLNVDYRFSQ